MCVFGSDVWDVTILIYTIMSPSSVGFKIISNILLIGLLRILKFAEVQRVDCKVSLWRHWAVSF